ncbi:MAG: glycogen/starch/alpha-glucan phosphorylase [Spirochaetales bacterium]|nr:glycogen/starch/alpha-glucan phosphorylase [Spirochaetales bacterium]
MDAPQIRFARDKDSIKWDFAEHLKYTLSCDRFSTSEKDRFVALAYSVRDRIIHQWIHTQQTHHDKNVKRGYYLSLEFLMGRAMSNNIINLGLEKEFKEALSELGYSYEEISEQEVDAGLGNGGLGRLAACFLDSMASLDLPAYGYGIRYNYGIFRQRIENGYQREEPDDWLRYGNPWEIERNDVMYPVHFGGRVETIMNRGRRTYKWVDTQVVNGIAYDTPIVGYGGKTVNTLRLWSARASEGFNFQDFNEGDYVEAVKSEVNAENLSQVLYPNDNLYLGKELRLRQQYFFVACSLADIFRRFKKCDAGWNKFTDCVAIQLNDTHPSLAVPELMRILVDEEEVSWETAWDIAVKTFGYTNHTLMPEALEKWPVSMLEANLPRHLQIIYEINHRFLQKAVTFFPGEMSKIQNISIIEEGDPKQVRMANLSIIGSKSTNGVAALHTELLKTRMFPEFSMMFPERFNNKTNGITQRRWLLNANPPLAKLLNTSIGDGWITDFQQIRKVLPLQNDASFQESIQDVKYQAKITASNYLMKEFGWSIDPNSIFDVQVKRIHEYKRQMLNALHIIMLYNRIKDGLEKDFQPMTFLFGGKAAPGYVAAKLIIKFINNISSVINNDDAVNDKLRVYFMPNYRVSMAETIIPATNISEQISLAGTEASGTGNMKFMCNGALTIGTLDGANIEIAEEAGKDNVFIFGNTASEVSELRKDYDPYSYCLANDEMRRAVDMILSGYFSLTEPGIFEPLRKALFDDGDRYMHFADLESYADVHTQARKLYADQKEWTRKSIINIGSSGKFSSDRTINQYAKEVWGIRPLPIERVESADATLKDAMAPEKGSVKRNWLK